MTTRTDAVAETLVKVIGDAAKVHMAGQAALERHSRALWADPATADKWWTAYISAIERYAEMQLDITERMKLDGQMDIETGKVHARLEFNTALKSRWCAVLYRDGKPLQSTVEERS